MTTSDPYDLARFVTAQQDVYEQVLAELRRGRKASHWMWFVFPQLAGLGQSPTSRFFALSGLAEARAYLAHPVLGPRLAQCAQLVAECREPAARIFGHLDAQKLRSCVTLFLRAASAMALAPVCQLGWSSAWPASARATDTFMDWPSPASARSPIAPTRTTTVEDSRRIAPILRPGRGDAGRGGRG
jgi:uncharacterized protein (DUF1810 family)